jgi:hypothetical protein
VSGGMDTVGEVIGPVGVLTKTRGVYENPNKTNRRERSIKKE